MLPISLFLMSKFWLGIFLVFTTFHELKNDQSGANLFVKGDLISFVDNSKQHTTKQQQQLNSHQESGTFHSTQQRQHDDVPQQRHFQQQHEQRQQGHQSQPSPFEQVSSVEPATVSFGVSHVHFGNITDNEYFPRPITKELIQRRKSEQYPFISLDYFIGKANTFLDRTYLNESEVHDILYTVPKRRGIKPIIFVPSEYLIHYAVPLVRMTHSFSLITVSNQPMCVPYFNFPQFCEEEETKLGCMAMDMLLDNPYLDKWYTKNPCIEHPKIVPIPIGPKWQWVSRTFYTEDTSYIKQILQQVALKPFALFKNFTSLLYSDEMYQRPLSIRERVIANPIDLTAYQATLGMVPSPTSNGNKRTSGQSEIRLPQESDLDGEALFHWKKKLIFNDYEEGRDMELIASKVFPQKDKLLYFNFDLETTDLPLFAAHKFIRRNIHKSLIENGFVESPTNRYAAYLQELGQYKFCISPPGVGIDTHRTWEALMVGTIPIVLSSPLNGLYDDLPVLVVDSYDSIDPDVLNQIYDMFHAEDRVYSFDKLFMDYWDKVMQ